MGISTFILIAIYSVFSITSKNFTTQNATANAQQSPAYCDRPDGKRYPGCGLDPIDSDNFGFEHAASNKICVTADSIDGTGEFNGTVDEINFESIAYEFQGNQIVQTLYEGTASENPAPLISNIDNVQFRYFDGDNSDLMDYGLSPPQVPADELVDIRTVEIQINGRAAGRN